MNILKKQNRKTKICYKRYFYCHHYYICAINCAKHSMKRINNKETPNDYETISFYRKILFISISLMVKIILRRIYDRKEIESQIPRKSVKELLLLSTELVHVMLKMVFTNKAFLWQWDYLFKCSWQKLRDQLCQFLTMLCKNRNDWR